MQTCKVAIQSRAATADGAAQTGTASRGLSGRVLTGKIGRLPTAIREALNQRLLDGQPADEILSWLNDLPEARAALEKRFGGSPITEQCLSRWRHEGYAGWLENRQTTDAILFASAAGRNISPEDQDALTGQLALSVAVRMVAQLRQYDEMPEGPLKAEALQKLVWSLTLLRRSEFYAGKLRLEQAKRPADKETKAVPEADQEFDSNYRKSMSLGGPRWNNFAKQWEGPGADEMREKEEVQRLVREELRRRKAAKEAAKEPAPPPDASEVRERGMALEIPLSPALLLAGREGKTADLKSMPMPPDLVGPPPKPAVSVPRYPTLLPAGAAILADNPAILRRNAIVRAGEPPPGQGAPPIHPDG